MKIEDLKTLGLSNCLDIFRDFDSGEVAKMPKSVRLAWKTGKQAESRNPYTQQLPTGHGD